MDDAKTIDIQPDEARQWVLLKDLSLTGGAYRLTVEIADAGGATLGQNQFDFYIEPAPTDTEEK